MFILSKLFSWFFLTTGIFVILLTISIILILKERKKAGIIILIITGIILYFLSITPATNIFMKPLEYHYKFPVINKLNIDAIIILSGGSIGPTPDNNMKNTLSSQTFKRTYVGYKIWKNKNVPIVTTGGKLFGAIEPEAETIASLLIELGVKKNQILIENKSRNTIENAVFIKKIIHEKSFKNIALVTSAYHMKRSSYIFKKLKINIIPVPTDYRTIKRKFSIVYFMPNVGNLQDCFIAFHEHIGLIYAKIIMKKYEKNPGSLLLLNLFNFKQLF